MGVGLHTDPFSQEGCSYVSVYRICMEIASFGCIVKARPCSVIPPVVEFDHIVDIRRLGCLVGSDGNMDSITTLQRSHCVSDLDISLD